MTPEISELEWRLENAARYIECYYADPGFGNEERLGHCKAVVEYLPRLITLLKLNEKRDSMIQDDDLWREINRLHDRLDEQARELERPCIQESSDLIIKIPANKPDPRLVFEDNYG